MMGLGETYEEVVEVMEKLREAGCDMLTLGQYLSPTPSHHPIVAYIHPDTFNALKEKGYDMGFQDVSAGPLVRSSYHAARALSSIKENKINGKGIEING